MDSELLIEALNNIASPRIIDWLGIIAPIVLSIVAIWIAVKISKEQNDIALYDERYELLQQIRDLVNLKRKLYNYVQMNPSEPDAAGKFEYFVGQFKHYFGLEDTEDTDLDLINDLEKLQYELHTKILLLIDIKTNEEAVLTDGIQWFLADIHSALDMLKDIYAEGEGFIDYSSGDKTQALCDWSNNDKILQNNDFIQLLIKRIKLSNNHLSYLKI